MRRVIGGMLIQDTDAEHEDRDFMDIPTIAQPSEAQWGDLLFAWRVAKWVPSNAVVLAQGLTTVGVGGGKPSRYDSIRHALRKADERSRGAMMASDAFFSYTDAPQAAIDAGISGIIQPGGADNDDEIVALCDAAGIPMVFTHRRHFKH
jgi:phosphoribosylaminoimidazolecarboxamide formyltransferase/IMP cyclohydrolase